MRILADECCDAGLVDALRADGHDVLSVSSTTPGAADSDVLAQAVGSGRLLLTEDRDYGELVFAGLSEHEGVLYVRFPGNARQTMISRARAFVADRGESLLGAFTVLTPGGARIRPRQR